MASRLTTAIVVLIVAGTLVAGLIVGAQRDDASGPVDLIVTNGRVYTGDDDGSFAEALAVRGNKILRVGSNREVKRLRRPSTATIDAHGATVLPGFNDAHAHLISGGLSLSQLDLGDVTTLSDLEEAVRAYAKAHPDETWVHGRGLRYQPMVGVTPRLVLDALVPDRPAYLVAYDAHTGWANTRALREAGITHRTPDPDRGTIVRDPRTGEPTGTLKESATGLIRPLLPSATHEARAQAVRDAVSLAHSLGVTSLQVANGTPEDLELFDEVRRAGALQLRVYAALSAGPGFSEADADRFDALRRRFPDDPVLKAGVVKLMVDGVIESHTAAMLAPYTDHPGSGEAHFTPEELARIVALLDRRGWQIMAHAIGDRGVRMTLDAFEHAAAVNPAPAEGRRHRIEHLETVDPADVARFGALGVVASVQPAFEPDQMTVWTGAVGPRAAHGWVLNSLLKGGATLAFGSDWPVVGLNPITGLHTAVTRTSPAGLPAGGWFPAERITLGDAIDAYTAGSAWASFDEHRKGRLEAGMLADLVILSGDIFSPDWKRLLDAEVHTTIFDGRVVFSREPADATE